MQKYYYICLNDAYARWLFAFTPAIEEKKPVH